MRPGSALPLECPSREPSIRGRCVPRRDRVLAVRLTCASSLTAASILVHPIHPCCVLLGSLFHVHTHTYINTKKTGGKQSLLVPVQLEQPQQPGQQNNTPVGTIVTNNNADVIPTTNANEFFPKERTADGSPKPPLLPSTPPPTPTPMPEDGAAAVRDADRATMVALGGSHSLVLTASGKVFAFGRQEHGRLGTGAEEVVS